MINILILGGGRLIGQNLLSKLVKYKHYTITTFTRGITTSSQNYPVNRLFGDRRKLEDLHQINDRDWDIVIDLSGYWPDALLQQLQLQKGRIGKYIFISTSSIFDFDENNPRFITEDEPTVSCSTEQIGDETDASYNARKAECERVLQQFPQLNYVMLRPGLIVGKHDYTQRLYYWLYRINKCQPYLQPEKFNNRIAFTDVDDLCSIIEFFIHTQQQHTIYHAISFHASLAEIVAFAQQKTNKKPEAIIASNEFLDKHQIHEWVDLPLWLKNEFMLIDNSRIKQTIDFPLSTLSATISKLLQYYEHDCHWPIPNTSPPSLSIDREQNLINELTNLSSG